MPGLARRLLDLATKHRSTIRTVFGVAVAAVCVAYLVVAFEWKQVADVLVSADWGLAVGAMLLGTPIQFLLRALRLQVALASLGVRARFGAVYLATAVGVGLAAVTPAQSGEAVKLALIGRDSGMTVPKGAGAFVVERALDVLVLLSLTALAALLLSDPSAKLVVSAAALVLLGAVLGGVALLRLPIGRIAWLGPIVEAAKLTLASPRRTAVYILTTVLFWLTVGAIWFANMLAVGADVTFARALLIVGLTTFAIILSMVPGGVGVSEATISGALILSGASPAAALGAAILLRSYGVVLVASGLAHWAVLSLTGGAPSYSPPERPAGDAGPDR